MTRNNTFYTGEDPDDRVRVRFLSPNALIPPFKNRRSGIVHVAQAGLVTSCGIEMDAVSVDDFWVEVPVGTHADCKRCLAIEYESGDP